MLVILTCIIYTVCACVIINVNGGYKDLALRYLENEKSGK